ncbi:unnamed protein product [Paramecium pentaurelia]|uniref:F-box domain-containing protein n=1 Tax=Paramecium pentaurelia TaxID=43138 RepID=A0A8S1WCE4_9CILI|nr:unnamed protein product [Paramecium pentaurelia]
MQIKKIQEINCQCCVYRNNIRILVKGEKGLLRKVVISLYERYPAHAAPIIKQPIKLKQPTLEQMFSRQKQAKEETKEVIEKKPLEMEVYIKVYCNGEELLCFNLDESINLSKSEVRQQTLNLQFADKILSLYECPNEILEQFRSVLIQLQNDKKQLLNHRKKIQNIQTQEIQQQEPEIPPRDTQEKRELNEIQKLKLQRRLLASQQQQQQQQQQQSEQIQKQIIKTKSSESVNTIKQLNIKFQLPLFIWTQILYYIDTRQLLRLRLTNKQFEQSINNIVNKLSYKHVGEIPFETLCRSLTKFSKLKHIIFGSLKFIKPTQLQDIRINSIPHLLSLDFKDYHALTDKLCSKFILQCVNLKTLVLPYNSKITSDTITLISQKLTNLEKLKLVEKDKGQLNEEIAFTSFLSIFQLKQLQYIRIPFLQVEFFMKYSQLNETNPFNSIKQKIKFGTIIFSILNSNQISQFLIFLQINNEINKLSIGELQMKNQSALKYTVLFDERIFQQINGILKFSFGGLVDDEFCRQLCTHNPEIKQLKIRSKMITDDGLKNIFLKCKSIEKIDVAFCSMICGSGFEYLTDKSLTLEYPKIQIAVNLDDYNMQCLEELLQRKAYDCKPTLRKKLKKI